MAYAMLLLHIPPFRWCVGEGFTPPTTVDINPGTMVRCKGGLKPSPTMYFLKVLQQYHKIFQKSIDKIRQNGYNMWAVSRG